MDDNAPKENPPPDFNKLDLSQLQGFSFGTQWTQEKPAAPDQRRERGEAGDRPRRDDRRDGPGGPDRRDRRTFRRPAGAPGETGTAGGAAPGGGGMAPERREYSGERRPRQGGEFRGGPRREGGHGGGYGGGERGARYGHGGYGGRPMQERGPYESPYYTVTFYPEDSSFNTLVQTIRKTCRTVELFEIARTVVAKNDRFVVVMAHKPAPEAPPGRPAAGAPAEAAPAAPKPKPVFHLSVPDGIPFETDDAAVAHVLSKHLDKFFDTAEAEVEPPKGNFQVINKCGVTGELLGPPNYHRYNQIVQQHYAAKVARMPFEAFRSRIETIRDPEVVNQWLAKMKKATRFTWKVGRPVAAAAKPAPAPEAPPAESASDTPAPAGNAAAAEQAAPPPPDTTPTFDTLEDARVYLLTHARDKVVRTTETARFHGKVLESIPPGEIRRAVEGALERQRRFPLDTANALRGRLRREHFTIFKKGSKGISYVCAVKRKFRVPGQTFADSIGALISFIEANPMIRASELAPKFLGMHPRPAPKPAETPAAPATAETPAPDSAATPAESSAPAVTPAPAPAPAEPPRTEPDLSIDDRARLSRMQNDLAWLVREGYVTEFIDGRLFAPPPMVEARKKEIESEEHDPENFPEVPATAASASPAAGAEAAAPTSGEPASSTEAAPPSESAPAEQERGAAPAEEPSGNETTDSRDSAAAEPAPVPEQPVAESSRRTETPPASGSPVAGEPLPVAPAATPNLDEPEKRSES